MDKLRAREYLVKSKMYRFMAMVFAVAGLLMFGVMYSQQEHIDGGIMATLRDPFVVLFMVFPFVPAIVLSHMAKGAEKKFKQEVDKPDEPAKEGT